MRIALSTSRRPSTLIRRFANRLAGVLGADRINRGKSSIDELALELIAQGYTHLILVDRMHGNPSRLRLFDLREPREIGYILVRGIRRLKPWRGRVDSILVDPSVSIDILRKFFGEPKRQGIVTVIRERQGWIVFEIRGKPYGVMFTTKSE